MGHFAGSRGRFDREDQDERDYGRGPFRSRRSDFDDDDYGRSGFRGREGRQRDEFGQLIYSDQEMPARRSGRFETDDDNLDSYQGRSRRGRASSRIHDHDEYEQWGETRGRSWMGRHTNEEEDDDFDDVNWAQQSEFGRSPRDRYGEGLRSSGGRTRRYEDDNDYGSLRQRRSGYQEHDDRDRRSPYERERNDYGRSDEFRSRLSRYSDDDDFHDFGEGRLTSRGTSGGFGRLARDRYGQSSATGRGRTSGRFDEENDESRGRPRSSTTGRRSR